MDKVRVGVVGCGKISGAYFGNMPAFDILDVYACADLMPERAAATAEEYGCRVMTVDELLADPAIDIVVNLTIPKAHYEVSMRALESGKHAYCEKPLTVAREEGRKLLAIAKAKGLLVGNAPDTFLGLGQQTARKAIDQGLIGKPVACTAFMAGHGHESWHPAPEFYYKAGGGPMFDMGPYYLTALVNLLGPVKRVTGSTKISFPERTITSEPLNGTVISVDVPTHIAGVMDFSDGAVGTIITSFDVWGHHLPIIEIYGTEGSLAVPDPNGFTGQVLLRTAGSKEWMPVEPFVGYDRNRGIGVADMAYAVRTGRAHRANGDLAYHVLDIMHAFHDASDEGRHVVLESTCSRPAPMPEGMPLNLLDE